MQNNKQNHNHNILDTSHIGRLLMMLSVPMFFGMITQNIYNIVDTIFIGHYVGSTGIAALSITFPIQMIAQGVAGMVSIGSASLISRLLGEGNRQRAERTLGNGIFFSVIFSIALMLVVLPLLTPLLKLIGASENVLPFARQYLTITMSGIIFNITGAVLLTLVRAEGNARVSMVAMIVQSVLNIILDAVFMISLKMGMSGAALAMVISQGFALIYVLSYYFMGESYLKIRVRNLLPDIKIVRSIFAVGVSQFVQTIAFSVSIFFLIRMASFYGGDMALSAFGVIQRIMMFASMPGMVLGQAMQPVLGFNYGAKRFRRALKTIGLAVSAATAFSVAAFLVLFFFPQPIIRIFTSDPQLIEATAFAARRIFIGLPLFGFFNVGQLIYPSIGKAVQTLIISVARPLLFMTPLVLILPRFLGMSGIWLSFPGSDILIFLVLVGLLIPLVRKFRKAAREDNTGNPDITAVKPELDTDSGIV